LFFLLAGIFRTAATDSFPPLANSFYSTESRVAQFFIEQNKNRNIKV